MTLKNTDNALIKIINRQTDDGNNDVITTEYKGKFYENNGKFYIMYKEDSGVSSMVKIDKTVVTVNRSGSASSVMKCEQGKEHSFLYHTQYGVIQMRVYTKKSEVSLDKNGGTVKLVYELYVNGGKIENDMDIQVKA